MLAIVIIIGIFPGCGNQAPSAGSSEPFAATTKPGGGAVPGNDASPFKIYRMSDGLILNLGDHRDDVSKVLGPDEAFVIEFEEDNITRVQYWDNDEVFMDYGTEDGIVRAMRVEDADWKVFNGLKIGSTPDEIKKHYDEKYMYSYPQTNDIWICYDKDGNLIEFTEEAAYIVRFAIKEGKTCLMLVQDNTIYL